MNGWLLAEAGFCKRALSKRFVYYGMGGMGERDCLLMGMGGLFMGMGGLEEWVD